MMKLVIISGLSGSGKTVALHTLEDETYYSVDNLHFSLIIDLIKLFKSSDLRCYSKAAVSIDARNCGSSLDNFPKLIDHIKSLGIDVDIVFLHASEGTLIKRFSETRRKHPLTHNEVPLLEAIAQERSMLSIIETHADLKIDTSRTNVHQLRALLKRRFSLANRTSLSLSFQSFGYKHGIPLDSDYIFDVRCLPNPYWTPELRGLTGQDTEVIKFLERHNSVDEMFDSIRAFLGKWIPCFKAENRSYLSISIGCTGGQHRSVYMTERISKYFSQLIDVDTSIRHRELEQDTQRRNFQDG